MVYGMDSVKAKKKPRKSCIERDIILHRDITVAYTQGGKAIGDIIKNKNISKNSSQ